MKVKDRIYGEIEIKDKVIVDLINSKAFQRLKGVSQDGAVHFIQPERNVTRYEHSIGVWYLSYRYNRPIEEQIASLLHDIPHTAFSHVIDSVVGDKKHAFHDKFTNEIILKSEIPNILKDNNIDVDKVLNKENYQLLENELPDISVDRWDYFMRDGYTIGFLPKVLIEEFLNGIYEKEQTFYFKDVRLASTFAILFTNFSRLIWLDPTSCGSYELLSRAIKIGLDKGYITQEDFWTTDEYLMNKLRGVNDSDINEYLDRLKPGKEFIYIEEEKAEFSGHTKPRSVDPLVETKDGLKRVSDIVPSIKHFLEEFAQGYRYISVKQL